MQDRLKCRIAVFERYKSEAWEFVKFIENNDKYGISTNGNVIQENVQSFIVHFPREKTPKHINITMEAIRCTGKKDKNGKLIFEEDIVKRIKLKNGNISIGKVIYCEDEARYKILISDNDKYSYKDYTKIVNLYDVAYHLEIIGNIYENPELLY